MENYEKILDSHNPIEFEEILESLYDMDCLNIKGKEFRHNFRKDNVRGKPDDSWTNNKRHLYFLKKGWERFSDKQKKFMIKTKHRFNKKQKEFIESKIDKA